MGMIERDAQASSWTLREVGEVLGALESARGSAPDDKQASGGAPGDAQGSWTLGEVGDALNALDGGASARSVATGGTPVTSTPASGGTHQPSGVPSSKPVEDAQL